MGEQCTLEQINFKLEIVREMVRDINSLTQLNAIFKDREEGFSENYRQRCTLQVMETNLFIGYRDKN